MDGSVADARSSLGLRLLLLLRVDESRRDMDRESGESEVMAGCVVCGRPKQ